MHKPAAAAARKPRKEKPAAAADSRQRSRYNITVSDKDIAKAKRNDSYVCVVSQAIARAVPDARRIETDTQTIRFTRGRQRYVFLTPYTVQGYVIAFDAGDNIQPFSFQLREPAKMRTQRLTDTGRKAHRAKGAARQKAARTLEASGLPVDTPEAQAEIRQAATAAYAEAVRSNPSESTTASDIGRRVPRVFKRKQRTYGHRLLRINQQQPGDVIDALPAE